MEFEDFILFDAFKKKDKFYLNLSIFEKDFTPDNLLVCLNSKILTFFKKIENTHKQCPTSIYIYNCNLLEPNNNYEVNYKNNFFLGTFEDTTENNKYDLTLTTLFKYDYKYFNIFYDYYKKQGVEHFYMYYNGKLNEDVISHVKKKDVTLICWDFPYRFSDTKKWKLTKKKIIPTWTTVSQFGQMHNALYKYGKDISKYMIFCDIDEYLHIPNNSIKYFILKKNKDCYGFNNVWSKLTEQKDNLTKLSNNFLVSDVKFNYGNRSKNIYKTNKVNTIGIHRLFEESQHLSIMNHFKLYHFYNWTNNPARKNKIIECTIPVNIQF